MALSSFNISEGVLDEEPKGWPELLTFKVIVAMLQSNSFISNYRLVIMIKVYISCILATFFENGCTLFEVSLLLL